MQYFGSFAVYIIGERFQLRLNLIIVAYEE